MKLYTSEMFIIIELFPSILRRSMPIHQLLLGGAYYTLAAPITIGTLIIRLIKQGKRGYSVLGKDLSPFLNEQNIEDTEVYATRVINLSYKETKDALLSRKLLHLAPTKGKFIGKLRIMASQNKPDRVTIVTIAQPKLAEALNRWF